MDQQFRIDGIAPNIVLPGGEVVVDISADGIEIDHSIRLVIAGMACRTLGVSSDRMIAVAPEDISGGFVDCYLSMHGTRSNTAQLNVGNLIADDMHMVASPAVDPADGSIMLMRSGGRGQKLDTTLYRYSSETGIHPLRGAVTNPSGFAFSPFGELFVTDRFNGDVYSVSRNGEASIFASGLGIATGIAFDRVGRMYVGDRSGHIFRVLSFTENELFATLEPSVAAYHLAFGPDERLYVSAPGLSSHDSVFAIDQNGSVDRFFNGLGRPQGMAFDDKGDLYIAACYQGRKGVVKIDAAGDNAELFAAGERVVGLCFADDGEMIVACGDTVHSIQCELSGMLL